MGSSLVILQGRMGSSLTSIFLQGRMVSSLELLYGGQDAQMGQELCSSSHGIMQSVWYRWLRRGDRGEEESVRALDKCDSSRLNPRATENSRFW